MRGRVVAVLAAFVACAAPTTPPRAASPAPPAPVLAVAYREPASVFEILDNASMWWSGKCDPEYRAAWKERFGVGAEDEERFAAYKAIRKRYYSYVEGGGADSEDLLGAAKPPDRIAEAFYDAPTIEAALASIRAFASPEDVDALARFFAAYRAQWGALLAESAPYAAVAASLQARLDAAGADAWARALATRWGVGTLPTFRVLFVWWPSGKAIVANNRGRFLLLKYDLAHEADASRDVDLPMHEIVHYVVARQPAARRLAFSRAFLAECDPRGEIPQPRIVEEPLAVVEQKLWLSSAAPERFDGAGAWYGGEPWVSAFSKRIFGDVRDANERGEGLDERLGAVLGRACAELRVKAR